MTKKKERNREKKKFNKSRITKSQQERKGEWKGINYK
jgi:hypothetical protein